FGTKWGDEGYMWIEYGCNNIGRHATWLRAQSAFYDLPASALQSAGAATEPFPRWPAPQEATAAELAKPDAKPPAPTEAIQKEGETVTVAFKALGGGIHPQGHVNLYSEKSWRNVDCLIVRIPKTALAKFDAPDGAALLARYKDRFVRVQGQIHSHDTSAG